jgi:nucleoside phosphorylase
MTVLILTPLPLEYDAVSKHLSGERDTIFKDAAAFDIGSYAGKHHTYKVIVREPGMKNIDMALATDRAIVEFNPQIVLLIGIAGGVKDVKIGDVLIATKAYGYESGKEDTDGFKSRPAVESFSGELLARAQVVRRQGNWKKRCDDGATEASIFIGPIAAGDKVVAGTNNPTYQRIKEHYNDTLGLEMEAIGFATALQGHRKIHGLAIRGISDLCEGKSETDKQNWQPIAAERAAAVGFELLDMLNADFIQLDEPVAKTASTTIVQPTPVNQALAIDPAEKAALVARVRKLIASGYSQEAIRELSAFTEKYLPNLHTDMLMIADRWEGLSTKIRRGVISNSESTVERNQIVGHLLDVLGRVG